MKKNKFVIGIPCKNDINSHLVDFLIENKITNVIIKNGFWVVKNRNEIIEEFLKNYDEDYLVFIDSDVVPKMEWIREIVNSGLKFVNIPCPIYKDNGILVTCLNPQTNRWYSLEEYKNLVESDGQVIKETQIAGGGCIIIHREVIKNLEKPRWEYPPEEHIVGEDVLFSYKVSKKGYSVFTFIGLLCDHYKDGVNLSDFLKNIKPKKKEIPKIIHQLWIGEKDIPYQKYRESIKNFHPTWKYIFWDKKRLLKEKMISKSLYNYILKNPLKVKYNKDNKIRDPYIKISDIARYKILEKYGGFYIDVDAFCVRPLDELTKINEMVVAFESEQRIPGLIGNSIIGCIPNHPVITDCNREIKIINKKKLSQEKAYLVTGPYLLTSKAAKYQNITILNNKTFYPIPFEKDVEKKLKNLRSETFRDSYLVHPWGVKYE